MDHFIQIYSTQSDAYHRVISAEDVDGNLLPVLKNIANFHRARVLDLGTGTGRLPLLLHNIADQIVGLDLHWDMLREHQKQREVIGGSWPLIAGDMRSLPITAATFDVVTAGWAIGHFTGWYDGDWESQIGQVLNEMHRVVIPAGFIIILETLSTGSLTPAPPTPALDAYYRWLETQWGFTRQQIRTDYQFATIEEAIAQTEFFFGPDLSQAIRTHGWERIPEWTGVWGKQV